MKASDHDVDAVERAGSGSSHDRLHLALQGLYRAYHNTSIYPAGHPAVPASIEVAAREFETLLTERSSVVVGVTRDHLLTDDERLTEATATGTLRSLAELLHELDVAAVEFHSGLAVVELAAFVEALGRARREGLKGADFAEAVSGDQVEHLRLCPIDYGILALDEGTLEEREEEDRPRNVWQRVSGVLSNPDTEAVQASVARMAEEVHQRIRTREGAGIGSLRTELHDLVEKMRGLDEEQRELVRDRLTHFVSALKPGLREDLLRVDARRADASLALISELADALPVTTTIEALEEIDEAGGRAPGEMMTLMNKLVRISRQRPQAASDLQDTLDRWGVSADVLNMDPVDLGDAMKEVFRRRSSSGFNPPTYQVLLDHLAKDELAGSAQPSALKYRDCADHTDTRMHAAEIAVQLLARADGDDTRPGLFGYVSTAVDVLLEHAKFEPVNQAALAARAHSLLKNESESTRLAARGFLGDFEEESRIQRILARARDTNVFSEDALSLLALGGATAIDKTLDVLSSNPSRHVHEPLSRLCRQASPEQLADVLADRADRGWSAIGPLLPVLRQLQPSDSVPLLEQLLGHGESKVRSNVLDALWDINRRSSSRARYLKAALTDESQRVVSTALRLVAETFDPAAVDALGTFVEGKLGPLADRQSDFDRRCRAARLMLRWGTAGCNRLCRALEILMVSARPEQARLARAVAVYLQPETDAPAVIAALKRWRFSPARLISLLWVRDTQPREEDGD